MQEFKWKPSYTRMLNKLKRQGSTYYKGELPDYFCEMLEMDLVKSTKFGLGNYELTKLGKETQLEISRK